MERKNLVIKIVDTAEEHTKAFLVRAIVYMHEQNCPYGEEFDQNDFAATQVVGLIGDEPVLTARIRYFADFAKLERLAVRPQFRNLGYGHDLLRYLVGICRAKGFNVIYLHANASLRKFYEERGFQVIGDSFSFSDHDYFEMAANFEAAQSAALSLSDDPLVLNRPEGKWDSEGPMEKSLERMNRAKHKQKAG